MKTFRFRLDRVLDWRRTELGMEETRLKQLHAARAALDSEKAALQESRDQAGRDLLARPRVDGADLRLLSDYGAAVKRLSARVDEKRRENQQAVAAQQQKLLEARRRLRLLEKLKDRRLEEWKYETERQMEADAPPVLKRPFPCSL
jgi:flagellar export protein FliJ